MSRNDIPEGSSETARPDRTTLIAFVLMVVLAGGNPVAVRFSNFELPKFWGAAIRFAAAALVFWIIVLVRRIALPKGRALIGVLLYGLLAVGASYAFLYWGLLRAPSWPLFR
jgi:drug/metabolite transporter (DMT)-like permease